MRWRKPRDVYGERRASRVVALTTARRAARGGLLWGLVFGLLTRFGGEQHPPTEPSELSRTRRLLGYATLAWFILLFMPTWLSTT